MSAIKVGVISSSFEAGGAQRVCLKMIQALKEAGHEVVLITLTKTDWPQLEKMMGKIVKPDREIVLLGRRFRGFAAYKPLLVAITMPIIKRKHRLDLLINAQADTMPVKADILYVHYPTFSEFESVDINLKYSRSTFWRIYISLYKASHRFFEGYLNSGVLVTNSSYSKKAIANHTNRPCRIIYPPVEVTAFTQVAANMEREDRVVSCGRYSPEKNYENVLKVAGKIEDAHFAVVGSLQGEKSSSYYQKLCSELETGKLANVDLLKAVDFNDLLALYCKSKIYLHSMKAEHFGIVVVEAMAAGLVPVVYQGGGPWEDILRERQGYYGFAYQTSDEAAKIIRKLLANAELRQEIVKRNGTYVKEFSDKVFKQEFINLLRQPN